uniref:ABC transporter permease n=1 Tax=Candidatus Electrothrix sp. TaxID=2170559 RepID=UPI004055BDB9
MILITAWKNVWRNKTRSMVVITSLTIGIIAGVFAVGLMNGTMEQRIDAAINKEISHIQINRPNFNNNYDIRLTIDNISTFNSKLLNREDVTAIANRIMLSAMANTATKSAGVQVIGIHPEQEKAVLDLNETIIPGTGSFFEAGSNGNMALIGEDLAKELNIIRYRINQATLDKLKERKVPLSVIDKLATYTGQRFSGENTFKKEIKKVLTSNESNKYGQAILEAAWSFRERSKLTLTFLDKENIQTGGMFRITGIYDINNSMFEASRIFVLNKDLQRLTGLEEEEYHVTLVKTTDVENSGELAKEIRKNSGDLEVRSWTEIQPDLAIMSAMVEKFHSVFMILILAALSFGIVNTMLMVVLERTRELGMLTAIGMNKKRVFTMIMAESVFLSLIGGVAGMIISKVLLLLTGTKGINFSGAAEGFEAMGFSAHIYPSISNGFFLVVTILIIITGILSSIYPALKALRLDPAEALRTE